MSNRILLWHKPTGLTIGSEWVVLDVAGEDVERLVKENCGAWDFETWDLDNLLFDTHPAGLLLWEGEVRKDKLFGRIQPLTEEEVIELATNIFTSLGAWQ